ncbi:MAG: hypothetical protein WAK55_18150 [Xanthobacteraceae bacterium]|jgi:hypothetical protein
MRDFDTRSQCSNDSPALTSRRKLFQLLNLISVQPNRHSSSLRQAGHPLELQDQAQGDYGLIDVAATGGRLRKKATSSEPVA